MNKELIIENPEIKRRNKTNLTLEEMTEDALYSMACSIERELKHPAKSKVWPRRWTVMIGGGQNNKAVVAKFEFHKFSDMQKSGKQIHSLIEED